MLLCVCELDHGLVYADTVMGKSRDAVFKRASVMSHWKDTEYGLNMDVARDTPVMADAALSTLAYPLGSEKTLQE